MGLLRRGGASGAKRKQKKRRKEPKNWLHALWLNWIKPIGIAVLVVFSFRSSFADWNDVPTSSMEPTILVGDRIFVNKLAYDLKIPFTKVRLASWGAPRRGDIVVFFAPHDGRRMVKRVVGLPGDTIEVIENQLVINGKTIAFLPANSARYERLDLDPQRGREHQPIRPYQAGSAEFAVEVLGNLQHPVMFLGQMGNPRANYRNWGPQTIPPGEYLLMGDNRNNSRDSRDPTLGFIPKRYIVGRAFGVAFSIDKYPSLRPRWGRFFSGFDQERASGDS